MVPMPLNKILLGSVALNLYPVNGPPITPFVEVLTVILVVVTEISLGGLGFPGSSPVDILTGSLSGPRPSIFARANVNVYAVFCVSPVMVAV